MNKPWSWTDVRSMDREQARYFALWRRRAHKWFDCPRIHQQLSEGLVALLAPELFGSDVVCRKNTRRGDPDLMLHSFSNCESVEVKGSGSSAWASVTKKDLRARYLVWAHFDTRYEVGNLADPIKIFVLPEPGRVLKVSKPRIKKFSALPGVRSYSFDFASKTLTRLS